MAARHVLALDIGSNSVGSMWFDHKTGEITTGTSIFPAGVDETDDKRGDPKNAKRRMTRRTRITLRRRAERKRDLRLKLIQAGLLPRDAAAFKKLLEETDPWSLRRKGLKEVLTPQEFGRVLLHLAQRRGALGLKIAERPEEDEGEPDPGDDGKVKAAIREVHEKMKAAGARTFGEFIAAEREKRVHTLKSEDQRPGDRRKGPREYRDAVRNKAGSYEHCADRAMIRDEFAKLWETQKSRKGDTAKLLTDELRKELDDESGDSIWRHKGLLFGQRRQTWDLGTLGRCVLEPTERCAPHADRHASGYLVVETVNNLKIIERGREPRPLTPEEREKIKAYLSGPLGTLPAKTIKDKKGKDGKVIRGRTIPERPKSTVSVTDLRELMGWGKATKTTPFRFNIETDEDREINTDWFSREVVHGAIGVDAWAAMPESLREGLNRAILRYNPDDDGDDDALESGVKQWAGLSDKQADALVAAWRRRPKVDAKRLNMSRRAVRNLLSVMDRPEPWPDSRAGGPARWLTQIEARKLIAGDGDFRDATTGRPLDDHARRRYATGAKGATARDRYYMGKHVLQKNGKAIIGPDGHPLCEPAPAPLVSNPVVRKAIHEVRRHLVEYMVAFGRKPDEVYIELAREAKMGKVDSDRHLFMVRLRNRVKKQVIDEFGLDSQTATQQAAAVLRVVLCMQQGGASARCPLCGKPGLTPRMAARGEGCQIAHIFPKGQGGHNGLTNVVLAHTKCNQDMGRRTPRAFWNTALAGGFDEGMAWVKDMYDNIDRIKPSAAKDTEGLELWKCYTSELARPKKGSLSDRPPNYFSRRADKAKIDQFEREVPPPDMTARQEAATKYAARQVMAYLSDAIYDGKGLPERSGGSDQRTIFATDGMWTSRLRREWGLFFDPHHAKAKGLGNDEEHQRKEKNRGDHRHHAIDAVVIGFCTRSVQIAWENREKAADAAGVNTADDEQMENYRRLHPLPPPEPFKSREEFRDAVKAAVFGDDDNPKPICHRPVKRKLIGYLHKETMYGPVLRPDGTRDPSLVTVRMNVSDLTPPYLRVPDGWDELTRKLHASGLSKEENARIRRALASLTDPAPGPGIVRDRATRDFLRRWLVSNNLSLGEPDKSNYRVKGGFTDSDLRRVLPKDGTLYTPSGVPIRSVVVVRSIGEPVQITRRVWNPTTNSMVADTHAASVRLYESQSNHHIELRENTDKRGKVVWKGDIVTTFEASQRKLAKLRQFKAEGVPMPALFRTPGALSETEKRRWRPIIAAIEVANPLVDRSDIEALGGRFVMSLCDGETVYMLHKETKQPGYFVVAKLDPPNRIVLVPHWDARAAGFRKDSDNKPIQDSKREHFTATPSDLAALAPPGHPHAVKVRVSPLGVVTILDRD